MKILLVEDDAKIASFVAKGLREASYMVDISPNGEEGCELGKKNGYDAAMVDLMLPKTGWLERDRALARGAVEAAGVDPEREAVAG